MPSYVNWSNEVSKRALCIFMHKNFPTSQFLLHNAADKTSFYNPYRYERRDVDRNLMVRKEFNDFRNPVSRFQILDVRFEETRFSFGSS